MPAVEAYQNLVLGSGEGGKYLAWHLARAGQRTAVIERRWIGGSCPNVNCLPSKNEIRSAEVAHLTREAAAFGVLTGEVSIDIAQVRARKRRMVDDLVAMHLGIYKASGAELIMGSGRLLDARTIAVSLNDDGGERVLRGERIFLNTGSHAVIPPIPGLADAAPLTSMEALELDRLPEHLIVLGGGVVGLEFAQAWRRFGSRVTIIEHGKMLAAREDADVAAALARILTDEGIAVLVDATVERVEGVSGKAVRLSVRAAGTATAIEGSDILAATGRAANTQGIGLEAAGVALDPRGFIAVNDRLETSAAGIWAIGDCAGSPQFTHVSFDDFRIIRDNLAGADRSTAGRLIPACTFTDPPLARVGLTEAEAADQGIAVRVARLPASAVLRTRTTGETQGFLKVLVGEDDRLVGFTMLGADAGEVMAAVQTAMLGNLPYTVLRDAVIAHPTMAEGLVALLAAVPPRAAA